MRKVLILACALGVASWVDLTPASAKECPSGHWSVVSKNKKPVPFNSIKTPGAKKCNPQQVMTFGDRQYTVVQTNKDTKVCLGSKCLEGKLMGDRAFRMFDF